MSDDDRRAALEARRQRLKTRREARVAAGRERVVEGKKRQAVALDRIREKRKNIDLKSKKKWRPSRWWLLLLLLILLLLLCRPCQCTPPSEPEITGAIPIGLEPDADPVEPPAEPPPPVPRTPRRARPALPAPDPGPPSWIDAFRLQVSARAPRLAECLEGSEAPGRFKWTTSVDPVDGTVSEHRLEPVLLSVGLKDTERTCVLRVLANPPYRLKTGSEPSTPSRVGLVVEF